MGQIVDWDAAYDNVADVADSALFPDRWAKAAAAFRADFAGEARIAHPYGPAPREMVDLFLPGTPPRGLAIFVHGGYWRRFDPSFWSHLMAGALARGWAVGLPGYTLCPDIRIAGIGRQVARAIGYLAGQIDGPIHLAGHSAGGHLVTRQLCDDLLAPEVAARIVRVLTISGVHDLRPLRRLEINETLQLTATEAAAESPALLTPTLHVPVICRAGAEELPEFRRQSALLANIWQGLGIDTHAAEAEGRHHFDIVEGLADPDNPLTQAWLD